MKLPHGYPEIGRPFILTAHPCAHLLRIPLRVADSRSIDSLDVLEMLADGRWSSVTWSSLRADARAELSPSNCETLGPGNGCLAWKYVSDAPMAMDNYWRSIAIDARAEMVEAERRFQDARVRVDVNEDLQSDTNHDAVMLWRATWPMSTTDRVPGGVRSAIREACARLESLHAELAAARLELADLRRESAGYSSAPASGLRLGALERVVGESADSWEKHSGIYWVHFNAVGRYENLCAIGLRIQPDGQASVCAQTSLVSDGPVWRDEHLPSLVRAWARFGRFLADNPQIKLGVDVSTLTDDQ